ncbi:butyrate kinase [Vibrio sp. HA2012]|uniref:butyrate kinase n=1 Tax=Vibrio sp. HA2012 TaxID=1971595 RepID=UPI000C2B8BAA|nr:butyrate kinase [Vibrio sp. HA2012]PJC86818.1 butyrate kinase [Vibrio sp. HA2012]
MSVTDPRILAINPGSTSTKFGLYENGALSREWTLNHSEQELEPFHSLPILEQRSFRTALILQKLEEEGIETDSIDAFVGRGGLLPPMSSGTYRVNRVMLEELRKAEKGEHASNLGAIIADALAKSVGVEAYVVDPVSVNERSPLARISGFNGIERGPFCHALNSKAVAKRYALEHGKIYEQETLIVAHLGGGICISAHHEGQMVDVTDASQEGPFSPERAGAVPALSLMKLCFSGQYSEGEVRQMLMGQGGIYSYLKTKDLREVISRMNEGDKKAEQIFHAMAYQIAKEIGAMAAALQGTVNAILLTGGMAHSELLIKTIRSYIEWIAPVHVYPGEEELVALSEGAIRVLQGKEAVKALGESSFIRCANQL